MRYFKARALAVKPLIGWQSGNYSDTDPLVLIQEDIPANVYGVCPLKIVGGELVERTELEMEDFRLEFLTEEALRNAASKADNVEQGFFMFGGVNYPMNRAAHLRYLAMANNRPATTNLQSIDGGVVALALADIDAFMIAFYDKLLNLTDPAL